MSAIGTLVKQLREEQGWTQAQLGEKVGLSGTNIARRESGRTRVKPSERKIFAEVFGLSLVEFDQRWQNWEPPRTQGGNGIPVINRAPAGMIVDYEEHGYDTGQGMEYIDFGDIQDRLAFAIIVAGDSMKPTLNNGDQLILTPINPYKPSDKLTNGKVVLVRFIPEFHDGGCTLARFYVEADGRIRLQKDNPAYRSIECLREQVQSISVAIERREKM